MANDEFERTRSLTSPFALSCVVKAREWKTPPRGLPTHLATMAATTTLAPARRTTGRAWPDVKWPGRRKEAKVEYPLGATGATGAAAVAAVAENTRNISAS